MAMVLEEAVIVRPSSCHCDCSHCYLGKAKTLALHIVGIPLQYVQCPHRSDMDQVVACNLQIPVQD